MGVVFIQGLAAITFMQLAACSPSQQTSDGGSDASGDSTITDAPSDTMISDGTISDGTPSDAPADSTLVVCNVEAGSTQPTCTDGQKNGTETDVDCGGSCPGCTTGLACKVDNDCYNRHCSNNTCASVPATCSDGIPDGSETAKDCGGPYCRPCADGLSCLVASDCLSGVCTGSTCISTTSYVLSVRAVGPGAGMLTSPTNCGTSCAVQVPSGTNQALTAVPSSGSTFAGWSDDECFTNSNCIYFGTSASTSVTVSSDLHVAARFENGRGARVSFGWVGNPSQYINMGGAVIDRTSGNAWVAGFFSGQSDVGGGAMISAGGDDLFLAKYSATGTNLLSRRYGSTANELVVGVAEDGAGDVLITGTTDAPTNLGSTAINCGPSSGAQGFVAKISGVTGAVIWARCLATHTDLNSVVNPGSPGSGGPAVTPNNDVVVTGTFSGATNDFGNGVIPGGGGYAAAFAASDGHLLWIRTVVGQGGGPSFGNYVAVSPSGDVSVIGVMFPGATADFGSGPIVANAWDRFVYRISWGGVYKWLNYIHGSQNQQDFALGLIASLPGSEEVVISGAASTAWPINLGCGALNSPFLARLEGSSGLAQWSRGYRGSSRVSALVGIPGGDVLVGFVAGGNSAPIGSDVGGGWGPQTAARFTGSGNYVWDNLWGADSGLPSASVGNQFLGIGLGPTNVEVVGQTYYGASFFSFDFLQLTP